MKEFASYSWEFNPLNNHPKIIKLKIRAFRICSICLNLNKLNIKPCQACIHCKTNEGVCATHDWTAFYLSTNPNYWIQWNHNKKRNM